MNCRQTKWRGREAWELGNELVELTHLTGGGHIVDFHFRNETHNINPFWVPQWKTLDPFDFEPSKHSKTYGTLETGKLLSGIAGHSLCLDLFGNPSPEEGKFGETLHGEAGVSKWKASYKIRPGEAELYFSVRLPHAGLDFTRSLRLKRGESVVYVRENVKNKRKVDQFFQWQQHATLGAPFLENCVIELPGARGWTLPHGYEGRELLKNNRKFLWPYAPRHNYGQVDLRRPLTKRGRGFLAAVQVVPSRTYAFVCALNLKMSLVIGYCFRREYFPWIALWEENRARRYAPWQGREQTRGLEFGASPLPLTRAENFMLGPIFGMPTLVHVPAQSVRTVSYVLFLARMPQGTRSIRDVLVGHGSLELISRTGAPACSVPASDIQEYFLKKGV